MAESRYALVVPSRGIVGIYPSRQDAAAAAGGYEAAYPDRPCHVEPVTADVERRYNAQVRHSLALEWHRRARTAVDRRASSDHMKGRHKDARRTILSIEVTPADAEMVAAWAEEGLKGQNKPVARESVRRFREAFSAAASKHLMAALEHGDRPSGAQDGV